MWQPSLTGGIAYCGIAITRLVFVACDAAACGSFIAFLAEVFLSHVTQPHVAISFSHALSIFIVARDSAARGNLCSQYCIKIIFGEPFGKIRTYETFLTWRSAQCAAYVIYISLILVGSDNDLSRC